MAIKQYITLWPYPCRVWLVELVEHDHCRAAIVEHQPPKVRRGARQRVRGHNESSLSVETVSESSVNVIVALPFCRNQEGQSAIRRQNIHAAVLLSVSGQQSNAALFHIQMGSHWVERLQMEMLKIWDESVGRMKRNWREHVKYGKTWGVVRYSGGVNDMMLWRRRRRKRKKRGGRACQVFNDVNWKNL